MDISLPRPWADPAWFDQVRAWIEASLEARGQGLVSLDPPRIRPWSVVMRLQASAGPCFFKAPAPASIYEAGLSQALLRHRPGVMPALLAVDAARGWMLMADGGETLRARLQSDRDLSYWLRLLPDYATLQRDMAGHVDEMLALGVPDRRLARLPALYAGLLADTDDLRLGQPDGLSQAEHRRLLDLRPRVADMAAELASYGLPETIQHDDFHDGNIFVHDGRYQFFDWGDACITHPFCTMLVSLRSTAARFDLPTTAPELARLRDAYLAPWSASAPPHHLLAAADLAQRLGALCRVLSWQSALAGAAEPDRAPHQEAVPGWLQEFLAITEAVQP